MVKVKDIEIKKSSSRILFSDVGSTVNVYNGKELVKLQIIENMVGHFFGEFIFTKRLGGSIHLKKNKRKKK